jgi:hypothetical protein
LIKSERERELYRGAYNFFFFLFPAPIILYQTQARKVFCCVAKLQTLKVFTNEREEEEEDEKR